MLAMRQLFHLASLPIWFSTPVGKEVDTDQRYTLTEGSEVQVTTYGKHLDVAAHGRFAAVASELRIDARNLPNAAGQLRIILASVSTQDPGWDAIFRESQYLEVSKYPNAILQFDSSKGAQALVDGQWVNTTIKGQINFHGVTRELTLPIKLFYQTAGLTRGKAAQRNQERITLRGDMRVRWEDFGIEIPEGSARAMLGDGLKINLALNYQRSAQ